MSIKPCVLLWYRNFGLSGFHHNDTKSRTTKIITAQRLGLTFTHKCQLLKFHLCDRNIMLTKEIYSKTPLIHHLIIWNLRKVIFNTWYHCTRKKALSIK